MDSPSFAVIGGSGLYSLLDPADRSTLTIDTPYGPPSGTIHVGTFAGRTIAFLTRHGAHHSLPPHLINYRANIWALGHLGVSTIVSSSAVGGLNPDLAPGTFLVPEQLIDRTWGRESSFAGPGLVTHVSLADPYHPELVHGARQALRGLGEDVPDFGTTVVINGPRFSTRAESQLLRSWGADIVNMTQYPEVSLAAELGMATVNLSFITDSDAGETAAEAVDASIVLGRLRDAQPRIRAGLAAILAAIDPEFHAAPLVPAEAIDAVLAQEPVPAPNTLPGPGTPPSVETPRAPDMLPGPPRARIVPLGQEEANPATVGEEGVRGV